MVDPENELKIRAEILQKQVTAGDARALARVRVLGKAEDAAPLQRKHCLAVVAREVGFSSWNHALRVLRGDDREADFGTLLHDREAGGTLNAWFTTHAEARAHLDARRVAGECVYLLAYKRQFFVVEEAFVSALGLDPDDPHWRAIGFDWARPSDRVARTRLYAKRLAALRRHA